MVEAQIVDMISKVAFPIFVCLWFMLRTEKVIRNNTKAFIDLKEKF